MAIEDGWSVVAVVSQRKGEKRSDYLARQLEIARVRYQRLREDREFRERQRQYSHDYYYRVIKPVQKPKPDKQTREEKNARDAAHRRERYANDAEYRRERLAQQETWRRKNGVQRRQVKQKPEPKPKRPKKWTKEYQREYMREKMRERARRDPIIGLAGEAYRLSELPPELQPIAALISETRKELRNRHAR